MFNIIVLTFAEHITNYQTHNKHYNKHILSKHIKDRKLAKMMKWKNFPQKKLQEEMKAREFLQTVINNISDQEFRRIVIKLIPGLEKSIEDSRESTARDQRTKK